MRAIKMGAFDFVEKPLSLEKTGAGRPQRLRQRHLEAENLGAARADAQHTMVGDNGMMRLREQVAMAAPTNGRVLIFGENGTGRNWWRAIFTRSASAAAGPLSRSTARPFPRS